MRQKIVAQRSASNVTPRSSANTQKKLTSKRSARKHSKFWLLDGGLAVIVVEKTRFRVYRSVLASKSDYFSKLFDRNKKNEEKSEEELKDKDQNVDVDTKNKEDFKILKLDDGDDDSDDNNDDSYCVSDRKTTASDFAALLTAEAEGIKYLVSPPPFPEIAAILRASTDLSFPDYRSWANHVLQKRWPRELDALDRNKIPYAIETVILGRTCNVPGILKRAFYELLRSSRFLMGDADDEATPQLEMNDVKRLINAREHLTTAWVSAVARFDPSFVCPREKESECVKREDKEKKWMELVHGSGLFDGLFEEYLRDPICGLQELMKLNWKGDGYCTDCVKMRKDAWGRMREKLWSNLEVCLELPAVEE